MPRARVKPYLNDLHKIARPITMFGSYDLSPLRRLTSNTYSAGEAISRANDEGPLKEDVTIY
ncbi:hypothetical protein CR513_09341, partial [Mucuna pruriens]